MLWVLSMMIRSRISLQDRCSRENGAGSQDRRFCIARPTVFPCLRLEESTSCKTLGVPVPVLPFFIDHQALPSLLGSLSGHACTPLPIPTIHEAVSDNCGIHLSFDGVSLCLTLATHWSLRNSFSLPRFPSTVPILHERGLRHPRSE